MKKNNSRGYVILIILLIVFTVIAFLLPLAKTMVFCVAYAFGMIAILSQTYFFKVSFSETGSVKSRFYGFPIAEIGTVYLIVQLVLSLLEMFLAVVFPVWLVLIINIIVAAAAFIGCAGASTMRDEIERQDDVIRGNVSALRELQSLANAIAGQCDDEEIKKIMKKVSEELQYSDPVSSEASALLENEMFEQLKDIQSVVLDGDAKSVKLLSDKLLANLTERNRICKLNK